MSYFDIHNWLSFLFIYFELINECHVNTEKNAKFFF